MIILGQISPELYWEWRHAASEYNLAKEQQLTQELRHQLMQREIEILKLRAMLFNESLDALKQKVVNTKQSYDEIKKKLEASLGREMPEGCVINENREVLLLEDEKTK